MPKVSVYLNFQGKTEEAFNFYKEAFKTEFVGQVMHFRDVPPQPGMPPMSEGDLGKIMHMCLPILGGTQIMGTDMLESMGHSVKIGNNTTINLETDTREETERLFHALSQGATEISPLKDMFWGYWACFLDRYGIRWMLNGPAKQAS